MFGIKCYGCGNGICPDELVQRSPRGDIYHLRCFICAICRKPLTTGNELYIINDGEFICKDDYNIKHRISSNIAETELDSPAATKSPAFDLAPGETLDLDQQERAVGTGATSTAAGGNGCLEAVAEDEDEEDMKASTNSETASHRCSVPPADRDCCDKDSKSLCGDDESGDEDETRNDENNISTKRRGPRTTIKAKQLELLKTAFSQTPKPTRHIREQLAQETGLTMRVIQVWFQNRRSKERRMKQLTAMGNPRRNNMFRPRRSGVRSLREFDGDSGDLLGAPGGGPGFAFYPDGPGNHPGDFFPGHPHGSVAGAGGGAGGGPHAHPHPPGMFEFHHFPPRHPQNINENMAHFGDMSGSGHGLPGGMSHGPEAHFGRPDLMSQNSSPNSMTSDGYGHPGFDPLHNHPGNPVPGSDSPVWQSMAMAQ